MKRFAVIYAFKVKTGEAQHVEKAWSDLTKLIYEYEGSLGSRLHKQGEFSYIAYAQWPDRSTWKQAGNKLPARAEKARKRMRASCEQIETLYELEVVDDLLASTVKTSGDPKSPR